MRLKYFKIPIIIILVLSSCAVTEENIIGLYVSEHSDKSSIDIKADGTFHFVKHDPYVDIPLTILIDSFRYFETSGNWILNSNDNLILNSIIDTTKQKDYYFEKKSPVNDSLSTFTFFDSFGDTIPISYVKYSDDRIVSNFQYRWDSYEEDLREIDTLTFRLKDFFDPWIVTKQNDSNYYHDIVLLPKYKSDIFDDYLLKVKKNKIIDKEAKYKRK